MFDYRELEEDESHNAMLSDQFGSKLMNGACEDYYTTHNSYKIIILYFSISLAPSRERVSTVPGGQVSPSKQSKRKSAFN